MLDELKTLITRLDRHRELRFDPPLLVNVSPQKKARYRSVEGAKVNELGTLQYIEWKGANVDLEGDKAGKEAPCILEALLRHLKGQEVTLSSPLNRKL